ncbi:MAG: HEAT repeat domain-containing protein [Anaplasmataceae bacterium]|nr:HEAT repeat domain-containing protein [Anaplasmataceae bacterium]
MFEDTSHLSNEMDHEIIMHRNVHFGGSFTVMLEYYEKEGRGSQPEIEPSRIRALLQLEEQEPHCFDQFLFSDEEEKVQKAKGLYQRFQALYDIPDASPISLALADLILSEEEEPTQEIQRLEQLGGEATQPLIDLLLAEDFYDPLAPGYGYAPAFAALILGHLGDPRAIIPLFQTLGRPDYFIETIVVDALHALGTPAKEFLLKRVKQQPFSKENTHAAIALISFRDDENVSLVALNLLEAIAHDKKQLALSTYLTLSTSGLKQTAHRDRCIALSLKSTLPVELSHDLRSIIRTWEPHTP